MKKMPRIAMVNISNISQTSAFYHHQKYRSRYTEIPSGFLYWDTQRIPMFHSYFFWKVLSVTSGYGRILMVKSSPDFCLPHWFPHFATTWDRLCDGLEQWEVCDKALAVGIRVWGKFMDKQLGIPMEHMEVLNSKNHEILGVSKSFWCSLIFFVFFASC